MDMFVEQPFDTGAITLNCAVSKPTGVALVLLHGGSNRWQSFEGVFSELVAYGTRLFAPDLRGHGKSQWVPNRYRLQDYTDDIAAFIEGQVGSPVFLFGHSLGGMIGLMVAAQHPDLIRAIAVGDAPLSKKSWLDQLARDRMQISYWRQRAGGQVSLSQLVEDFKNIPVPAKDGAGETTLRSAAGEASPLFDSLAMNIYQCDPDMFSALIDRAEATAAGYEPGNVFPTITCPVLLMQADPARGGMMADDDMGLACSLLASAKHIRFPGLSHIFHNEQQTPVLNALFAFFDDHL